MTYDISWQPSWQLETNSHNGQVLAFKMAEQWSKWCLFFPKISVTKTMPCSHGKDTRSHTASDKKLNGVWERGWSHKSQGYIQSCKAIVRGYRTRVVSLEVIILGWYHTRVSYEGIVRGYCTRVSYKAIVQGCRTRLKCQHIASAVVWIWTKAKAGGTIDVFVHMYKLVPCVPKESGLL